MAGKIGEHFVREMIEKGPRELGGLLYNDSNIAVPMYPLRGNYGAPKEPEAISPEKPEPSFEELHPVEPGRDDGPGDPNREIERE